MKNLFKKHLTSNSSKQTESDSAAQPDGRREFLKKSALGGGLALSGFMFAPMEDTLAQSTSKVNRNSSPSELKITDMRYCVPLTTVGRCPIIRIDTNQGIYGLGEVRDGGDVRYALMLKSRLLGQNPCNVELLFKAIKQFGFHGRQAGGVCGVEMALWDLAGKAYNVPAYQLLGGKYRDTVRLYADTPEEEDSNVFSAKVKDRLVTKGYTWLKMDLGIELIKDIPGTTVNSNFWKTKGSQWNDRPMTHGNTKHQFTQVQITDKGLDEIAKYVDKVRTAVGYDVPLSSDHFGHFDMNNSIRLAKKLEPYRLAWMEDVIPWEFTDQLKEISASVETPICTGEDIYLKEEFIKLVDAHAVDIIHPDLSSSGGLLETKKIGDYAEEKGVAMAMHFAGTPVAFMANVHCAAATQNVLALEHHNIDLPYWESYVKTVDKKPLIEHGFANVPNSPGLGIELNEEVLKQHLDPKDKTFFAPTPEWNEKRSWDRMWS
ncbi:mandelate racemase/muconate lactonizing enzyme family protein [Mucilaginibacter sp.]|jgi:L-alanine-DL-glutamate epimerase-like enolase superfamily enzyme|uniref:mandelate racemase/muconate lactonizing enzyme family protein n=1 Tax=Mucilaginibacter sp. TaxID=1882438 RepID=UPI0035642ABB